MGGVEAQSWEGGVRGLSWASGLGGGISAGLQSSGSSGSQGTRTLLSPLQIEVDQRPPN